MESYLVNIGQNSYEKLTEKCNEVKLESVRVQDVKSGHYVKLENLVIISIIAENHSFFDFIWLV